MQTEKSQSEGKQVLLETRFTEFPALSVDPRVGIFRSAEPASDRLNFLPIIGKTIVFITIFLLFSLKNTPNDVNIDGFGPHFGQNCD